MTIEKQTLTALCPDCEDEFMLKTIPQKEDIITCPHCWAGLVVISLDPLELGWDVALDENDWDSDDE